MAQSPLSKTLPPSAEANPAESERLLSLALDAGQMGMWVWDLQSGTAKVDVTVCRLFGLEERAEYPAEDAFRRLHPADSALAQQCVQDAIAGNGELDLELRVPMPSGTMRWLASRGRVVRDANGDPVQILGVNFDITARKQAEVEVRRSDERYRAFIGQSSEAIWRFELPEPMPISLNAEAQIEHFYRHGFLAECNDAMARQYGYQKAAELIGTSLVQMLPREDPANLAYLRAFIASDYRLLDAESHEFDREGEPRYFLNNLIGIVEDGLLMRVWGTQRDITASKLAEAALRESEESYRTLFDSIDEGFCVVEMLFDEQEANDYRFLQINPAFEAQTGLIGAKGKTMRELAPEHEAHWFQIYGRVALTGESIRFENRAEQLSRWFDVFAFRTGPAESRQVGILFTDITARKQADDALRAAKAQAESASQAKDNFLAALSHELRTPLTPVLMTAASLFGDQRLPQDVREQLGMIERNIALEARLIDDLLDLTRITRGKLPLRNEPCDVHLLIAHAVEIVRDEAQEKRITLNLEMAARKSGLSGDPTRLQQVFWNLLKNAVKFTPLDGRITVSTRDADGTLELEISDSGVGFAPNDAERIFRPFEQGEKAGDHRFGGLGLGLAIAKAIVQLHGGAIRGESAGPGHGATFVVDLPDAYEPKPQASAGSEYAHPETLKTGRVLRLLVVEDHEPTLEVVTRLLRRAGHHVITAQSVGAALTAAEAAEFDVVISDLGLPDGTGVELMSRLRTNYPHLRGIALSGYGMEEDVRRSREAGFEVHLTKPVNFDQLRQALDYD